MWYTLPKRHQSLQRASAIISWNINYKQVLILLIYLNLVGTDFLKNSVPKLFFPRAQGGSGVAPFQKMLQMLLVVSQAVCDLENWTTG